MPVNDISPGFVVITYAIGTRIHKMTLPVFPAVPDPLATNNELYENDGDVIVFGTAVTAFVNLIKGFYNTATDFTSAELWSKPTPADNPLFIEAVTLALNGTSGTVPVVDGQAVLTHRTTGGGLHRLYLMESTFPANTRELNPFASGALNSLSAFMRGVNGWVKGRDGGQLTAPIAFTTKTNDALRKRRLNL